MHLLALACGAGERRWRRRRLAGLLLRAKLAGADVALLARRAATFAGREELMAASQPPAAARTRRARGRAAMLPGAACEGERPQETLRAV